MLVLYGIHLFKIALKRFKLCYVFTSMHFDFFSLSYSHILYILICEHMLVFVYFILMMTTGLCWNVFFKSFELLI